MKYFYNLTDTPPTPRELPRPYQLETQTNLRAKFNLGSRLRLQAERESLAYADLVLPATKLKLSLAKKVVLFSSCVVGLHSTQIQASAWVKDPGAHYAKLGYSQSSTKMFRGGESATDLDETVQSISIYAETGLGWLAKHEPPSAASEASGIAESGKSTNSLWPMQLAIGLDNKSITRESPTVGDSFTSRSFGDAQWLTKHSLVEMSLSPVNLIAAGYLGGVLPTTAKRFRTGSEDSRNEGVDPSRHFLLSTIADGVLKYSTGGVITLNYLSFWYSYDRVVSVDSDFKVLEDRVFQEIGSGLPMNSWIQLSVSKSKKLAGTINGVQTEASEFVSTAMSTGITVYDGIAIEAGISIDDTRSHGWNKSKVYLFGISHRTL